MATKQGLSLVDYLADSINFVEVSLLHDMDVAAKRKLLASLDMVEDSSFSLFHWNDALTYITGLEPTHSVAEARREIERYLGRVL